MLAQNVRAISRAQQGYESYTIFQQAGIDNVIGFTKLLIFHSFCASWLWTLQLFFIKG